MHRLRHRHLPVPVSPFKGVTPQRLCLQVVTQRRTQFALGFAVEYRHIFIALSRQLQLAVGVQFANGEIGITLGAYPALELGALGTTDPQRKRIGLGAAQQGLGVAVEFLALDRIGIDEKPAQPVEALFLVFEPFGDAAVTFTGQQLETLPQLLVKEIEGRPGQQAREDRADNQYQQRDQPGRSVFTDKTQNLGAHGVQRHKGHSKRQVLEMRIGHVLSYSY
ncbi:hypothetical protein D3C73_778020 [compost metagenome]